MVDFVQKTLQLAPGSPIPSISAISHMEIGPDGLLYASSIGGEFAPPTIYALQVDQVPDSNGDIQYVATVVHQIELLNDIQNHNDDGTAIAQQGRLVLGFDVVGTPTDPIIYVNSNDPRVDTIADSNSGTLHEIRMDQSGEWQMVDLVRGLPRSQHDHVLNAVEYVIGDDGKAKLLLTTGGHTNAGSTSAQLKFLPEYLYSGAVIEVDLETVYNIPVKTDAYGQQYRYNLPTLDDPTRAGVNEGVDASIEIYGGNGGLNQAKWDPDGPIDFYATGLRNATEILELESGALITADNGGNPSWGDSTTYADVEIDGVVQNIPTNLPSEGGIATSNQDQIHLITEGAYLGHPNPFRAVGHYAGLYVQDETGTPLSQLPSDFDTLYPEELQNIQEGEFIAEGQDGALGLFSKSNNGLAEYTFDGAFNGNLEGDIFTARFGTGQIVQWNVVDSNDDGIPDQLNRGKNFNTIAGAPIDILAPKEGQANFGVMYVSTLTETGIIVFEPSDGSQPPPIDLTDRDNDGIADNIDPFQYDATNGASTVLLAGAANELFWDFESLQPPSELPGGVQGFAVGISGFQTNGQDFPETLSLDRFAPVAEGGDDVVLGGTANTVLIGATPSGSAEGAANDQYHGLQSGFTPTTDAFTVTFELFNQFAFTPVGQQSDEQKLGGALSVGDQDSFIALYIGRGFMELYYEENGVEVLRQTISEPSLLNVDAATFQTFVTLDVDRTTGLVTASYDAATNDGQVTGSFEPVQLYGDLLDSVQGEYRVGGQIVSPAWTLLSTAGAADLFQSNLGSVRVTGRDVTPSADGAAKITAQNNSTFNDDSFIIENTGSTDISKVILTLDDQLLQDVFFDTDGSGDAGNPLPFTITGGDNVGATNASGVASNPLPTGGFETLTIDFSDFNPGETLEFKIDMDPITAAGFGSGSPQGAVGGHELSGLLATVVFDDGSQAAGELFFNNGTTSIANISGDLTDALSLSIGGIEDGERGTVGADQQTLNISGGPANATVRIVVANGDTLPDDPSGEGLFTNPLDFNSIEGVTTIDVTLNGQGSATQTISLADPDPTDPNDGVFRIQAAVIDGNGEATSRVGAGLTVKATDGANQPPNAVNDSASVAENATTIGNVLSNDTDPDNDTLSVLSVNGSTSAVGSQITLPSGALLTLNANGSYTYNPNGAFDPSAGQTASDSFTYVASDGNGGSDSATVNVTITSADSGGGELIEYWLVNADTDTVLGQIDPDGYINPSLLNGAQYAIEARYTGTETVESISFLIDDALVRTENLAPYALFGDGATTAPGDYYGEALPTDATWTLTTIAHSQNKGNGQEVATRSLTLTTIAPPDPAVAFNVNGPAYDTVETNVSFAADPGVSSGSVTNANITGTDIIGTFDDALYQTYAFGSVFGYDIALDAGVYDITLHLVEPFFDSAGSRVMSVSAEGATPNVFSAIDIVAQAGAKDTAYTVTAEGIQVSDGVLDLDFTATVNNAIVSAIEITPSSVTPPQNQQPTATNDFATTTETGTTSGNLLSNDTDPDNDTLTVLSVNGSTANVGSTITLASGALLTVNANGSYTYNPNGAFDPAAGQTDTDSFVYVASDGNGGTDDATVNVTITSVDSGGGVGDIELWLVNADTDQVVGQIGSDGVIDPSLLNGAQFAIEARYTGPGVAESMTLQVNGGPIRTENNAPYSLFGDSATGTGFDFDGQPLPTDPFQVSVAVYDQNGASGQQLASSVFPLTVSSTPPPTPATPVAAFNFGDGAFSSTEFGIDFAAGPAPDQGTVTERDRPQLEIAGANDDDLFSSYIWGESFSFNVAVPENGDYVVEIYSAEMFFTSAGQRVFDVALEGSPAAGLQNIEPFVAAGGANTAFVVSDTVTVTDGVLNIDVTSDANNALISAIAIWDADDYPL